jgi:hypothetical protein
MGQLPVTPAPPVPPPDSEPSDTEPSIPTEPVDTEPLPDEPPVLPQISRDERDEGWGDERDRGRRDADWYRRERPPHHE